LRRFISPSPIFLVFLFPAGNDEEFNRIGAHDLQFCPAIRAIQLRPFFDVIFDLKRRLAFRAMSHYPSSPSALRLPQTKVYSFPQMMSSATSEVVAEELLAFRFFNAEFLPIMGGAYLSMLWIKRRKACLHKL
jgi:hypothetical protein